jgi:hypothetical protein
MAHLFEPQITNAVLESTAIARRRLFRQDPRKAAVDLDFGPKKLAARADVDVGATSQVDSGS